MNETGLGDHLLDAVVMSASDLHVMAGLLPMVRISGKVRPLDHPPLTANAAISTISLDGVARREPRPGGPIFLGITIARRAGRNPGAAAHCG